MATKGDIVNGAYQRLRISGLTISASPEEIAGALEVLEDMCATYEGRNICLNYNFTDDPDPSDDSRLAREFIKPIKDLLAWNMAMFFGKQMPPALDSLQRSAMSLLYAATAKVNPVQAPRRMARGSGNTNRYNRWQRFSNPQPTAPSDCSTNFITYGGMLDFSEDVSYFLNGETVASFTMTPTNNLVVLSSAELDGVISYRVQCGESARDLETIDLEVTTDTGRKQAFIINFKCAPSKIAVQ